MADAVSALLDNPSMADELYEWEAAKKMMTIKCAAN
jgi:hypothetical protein